MTSRERVQEWIEWSRQNLPETEHCPELDVTEIKGAECPWWSWESLYYRGSFGEGFFEESNREERDEFLILFEDQLSRDPGDVSIRFTALNFHCRLLFHYDSNVKGFCDAVGINCEEGRKHVAKNLAYLVRLLPVDACTDWRAIRWEIGNAYYIRDWERAGRLYDRLVALDLDVPNQAERHLLWGQFHFLRVLGPKINPKFDLQSWKLGLYDSYDRLHIRKEIDDSVILLFMGLVPQVTTTIFRKNPKEQITLDDAERDRIYDAAHDLHKGLTGRADISPAYRSMLACCYFANDDFHNAAKNYELLVRCIDDERIACLLYQHIATSYQRAGEAEKAKDALEQCASAFPDAKGIYEYLAEIQTRQGDKDGAAESLRKEADRNKGFGEDWKVSLALMQAETRATLEELAASLKEIHKSYPRIFDPIDSLLRQYWEPFRLLGVESREGWIMATYYMHFADPDPKMERNHLLTASSYFATAVELQLKSRVFASFRDRVSRGKGLRSLVLDEKGARKLETKEFCDYILFSDKKLNLGDMVRILKRCGNVNLSKKGIFHELQRWTKKKCSILESENLTRLDKICEVRNPATHRDRRTVETITREDVQEMAGRCRTVLEALVRSHS